MPWLPLIFSALASGISGGMQGSSAARQAELENQRGAQSAAMQRKNFLDVIDRYRSVDFEGANARGSAAEFSNMADQIDAMTAARGTFGGGGTGSRAQQTMALSNILTGLASRNAEMQFGREQAIAQLMADPAFSTLHPDAFDPRRAAMRGGVQGFLGGLGAGAMSGLGSLMGSEAGLAALGIGGTQATPEAAAVSVPIPNATVSYNQAPQTAQGRATMSPMDMQRLGAQQGSWPFGGFGQQQGMNMGGWGGFVHPGGPGWGGAPGGWGSQPWQAFSPN